LDYVALTHLDEKEGRMEGREESRGGGKEGGVEVIGREELWLSD